MKNNTMKNNTLKSKKAFTLVELIVASLVLVILSTLAFYAYTGHLVSARDSQRKAHIAEIWSILETKKENLWVFPYPWDAFDLKNGAIEIAHQWKLEGETDTINGAKIPFDPLINIAYPYSITHNRQEYQVAWVLENDGRPEAHLFWNYRPVSNYLLPSLIMAIEGNGSVDVTTKRSKFVIDKWTENLPYTFEDKKPKAEIVEMTTVLKNPNIAYRQNIDYRSCDEIYEDGKSIGDGIYQIRNEDWVLEDIVCTFTWRSNRIQHSNPRSSHFKHTQDSGTGRVRSIG